MAATEASDRPFRTRATLLTPAGRSAIAVIRIEGPAVAATIERSFHSPGGRVQPGDCRVGEWRHPGGGREEVVLVRPTTTICEVHCHGGPAVTTSILESLQSHGIEAVSWSSWLADQAHSAIQSEAMTMLPYTTTLRTACILIDQLRGALDTAIREILKSIGERQDSNRSGRSEQPDLEGFAGVDLGPRLEPARRRLQELMPSYALGRHLVEPWQVVLGGPANVGKSSLVNRLLGFERAIVMDRPGTTRDVVTGRTVIDGWPIEFSDTPGWRAAPSRLESAALEIAQSRWNGADLRIACFECPEPCPEGGSLESPLQPKLRLEAPRPAEWRPPDLTVVTKIDQRPAADPAARPPQLPSGTNADDLVATSARTGEGLPTLLLAIRQRLALTSPEPQSPVVFTERQGTGIRQAIDALARKDIASARQTLEQVVGDASTRPMQRSEPMTGSPWDKSRRNG